MEKKNEEIQLDKLKIEDVTTNQFDETAKGEKKLDEDDEDKVVKTSAQGEDLPENLIKDEYMLFQKDATWESLGVREEIIKGLIDMGFTRPSRIQASTFPLVMKKPYSHLIAQAHNGSGKTGAFGIATLNRIDENSKTVQAIIFAHTKELVNQTVERLSLMAKYTNIKIEDLNSKSRPSGVHIYVSSPKQFEVQFLSKNNFILNDLRIIVLDEADYMLKNDEASDICDKTFTKIIEDKIGTQVLFFSATYTENDYKTIKKYFRAAHMIKVEKGGLTLKNVRQMYYKANNVLDKVNFIEEYLKRNLDQERVIIFVNTKNYVEKLAENLRGRGYKVYVLMGGLMDPTERVETVRKFNKGEIQILITTNLLSRGFDEKLVKLIINFDLPVIENRSKPDLENYLHRIGRTGRFGQRGIGLTLVFEAELKMLKEIEEHYQSNIEEIKSMDDLISEFKKIIFGE